MSLVNCPTIVFIRQCLKEDNGKLFWKSRPRDHFRTFNGFKLFNSRFAEKEAGAFEKYMGINGMRYGFL